MSESNEINEIFTVTCTDFTDKEAAVRQYVAYWLTRTQSIFEYKGLPDTIPARNLEILLQTLGSTAITEVNGSLYAFRASYGGKPDVYYQPTLAVVANPALNFSGSLVIGKECVRIRSDSYSVGLMPLLTRYATKLAENDLTLKLAQINSRMQFLLSAPDDATKRSAEDYIRQIEQGKAGVIGENAFLDGIRVQPGAGSGAASMITPLIELEQYIKSSCMMDLGISSNYNMKREALNSAESSINDDTLLPFVADMLKMRKLGIDEVNALYGTSISVDLAGAWKERAEEVEQMGDTGGEEVTEDEAERDNSGMAD